MSIHHDLELISILRNAIHAAETVHRFRVAARDWTRQRKLPFALVLLLIVRGHKLPLQHALNTVFGTLDTLDDLPTASAYSQARRKLKPEVFLYLNQLVTDYFYQHRPLKTWQGHRIVAVDGTYLTVPDTPETRARYSLQENQWAGSACVQALGSVLYDPLNDLGLNVALDTKRAEKDFLFDQHLPHSAAGDVVVLDRLYADSAVFAFWAGKQRNFVIRLPRGRFPQVQAFWASDAVDTLVDIVVTDKHRAFLREHGLPEVVRIRVVKVVLDTGEIEVLATSLLDQERYAAAALKQVYGWRWGIETYFDRLKNLFELERFSGLSVQSIEQDVYAMVFLATLESVLSRAAQDELTTASQVKGHQYPQLVNRAVSYGALVAQVVALLGDVRRCATTLLHNLQVLFKTNPSRQRPGRTTPRDRATPSQRLRFYRYTKRCIA